MLPHDSADKRPMKRIIGTVAVLALAIGIGACGSSQPTSSVKLICTKENTSGCPNQAAEQGKPWNGTNEGKPSTGEATPATPTEATPATTSTESPREEEASRVAERVNGEEARGHQQERESLRRGCTPHIEEEERISEKLSGGRTARGGCKELREEEAEKSEGR
jgi:hypothetical protein